MKMHEAFKNTDFFFFPIPQNYLKAEVSKNRQRIWEDLSLLLYVKNMHKRSITNTLHKK